MPKKIFTDCKRDKITNVIDHQYIKSIQFIAIKKHTVKELILGSYLIVIPSAYLLTEQQNSNHHITYWNKTGIL